MKRDRTEFVINIANEVQGTDAWGTSQGIRAFGAIDRKLVALSMGTLVALDFRGLKRSDASFSREAVVETLRKHRPRLLFVARGFANADVEANLALALEKREQILVVRDSEGNAQLLGAVSPTLREGWSALRRVSEGTSSWMSSHLDMSVQSASNRLTKLADVGLAEVVEGSAEQGGKQYRYFAVE